MILKTENVNDASRFLFVHTLANLAMKEKPRVIEYRNQVLGVRCGNDHYLSAANYSSSWKRFREFADLVLMHNAKCVPQHELNTLAVRLGYPRNKAFPPNKPVKFSL